MRAVIELELFGDNDHNILPPSSWVAEIVGLHDRWKYDRRFLNGKKDYSRANSKGSRGVFIEYVLETGKIYEVKASVSWQRTNRYFAKVSSEGAIIEISESDVRQYFE